MSGWPRAVQAIGEPGLHFHDLRHTGNTFAAERAAPGRPPRIGCTAGEGTQNLRCAYLAAAVLAALLANALLGAWWLDGAVALALGCFPSDSIPPWFRAWAVADATGHQAPEPVTESPEHARRPDHDHKRPFCVRSDPAASAQE